MKLLSCLLHTLFMHHIGIYLILIECQTHILNACEALNKRNDIVQEDSGLCTLTAFKEWLAETRAIDFPVSQPTSHTTPVSNSAKSVHHLLAEFLQSSAGKKYRSRTIFNRVPASLGGDDTEDSEKLRVVAMIFKFYSTERSYEGGFKAMAASHLWDKALEFVNHDAPQSAGKAFHASELWTRAITEVIAVTGTVTGVSLVLISSFLVVWLFTSSTRAAVICTVILICVLSITSGLFWLFGWELGIIEAVGISILLGAAVDYPAHIIERFVEIGSISQRSEDNIQAVMPESYDRRSRGDRSRDSDYENTVSREAPTNITTPSLQRQRVIESVTSVGVSVLNASVTTVMSCSVLVFCTVQIFQKVGLIMLTASAVSMLATIVPLPVLLTRFGPKPFHRTLKQRLVVSGMVLGTTLVVLAAISVVNNLTGGALWS